MKQVELPSIIFDLPKLPMRARDERSVISDVPVSTVTTSSRALLSPNASAFVYRDLWRKATQAVEISKGTTAPDIPPVSMTFHRSPEALHINAQPLSAVSKPLEPLTGHMGSQAASPYLATSESSFRSRSTPQSSPPQSRITRLWQYSGDHQAGSPYRESGRQ